jgi:PAS domain S-box-containing protein
VSEPATVLGGWRVGAEDFLAAVLQTTAQPIWVVDADGLIRYANASAIATLGYERADELLGRPSHETIHHTHADGTPYPAAECPMLLPRTTGETVTRDVDWFFRRDGSMFPVSYVSVPLDVGEGRGAVVAFTDIAHRLDVVLDSEQAALRRVAALVAGGADSGEVFAAVAREVAEVLALALVVVGRYEDDGTATVIASWSERPHAFQTGTTVRPPDMGLAAAAPIVVAGEIWGVIAVASPEDALPARIEERLAGFTELLSTAIANTQARDDLRRLAEDQSALRRVATLVAQGVPPADVFAAVAAEIAQHLDLTMVAMFRYDPDGTATVIGVAGDHPFLPGTTWPVDPPTMLERVRRTGRTARIDDYSDVPGRVGEAVRSIPADAGIAAPIVVDGEVWGVVSAGRRAKLPADTEQRLRQFTDLVATAISRTQAREELRLLAEEQAALRRVATLVAEGAPPEDVFAAVAAEVASVLDLPLVEMCRYEADGTATVIGSVGDHPFQTGTTWTLDGPSLTAEVKRTGRPARVTDYGDAPGSIGVAARAFGVPAGVGAPIIVDGRIWGVVAAGGGDGVPLPDRGEHRLTQFTELVATAISNTQAREDIQRLADEQAALRRLATLVAEGAEPRVVFEAVAEETGRLLGATTVNLVHFAADGINVTMSGWSLRGVHVPTGSRLPIDGGSINAIVRRTARPARCDTYEGVEGRLAGRLRELGIRSEVGAPVVVEGEVWGALIAGTDEPEPLPPGTEDRLAEFAELIATAVANATTHSALVASRARIAEAADDQRRRVVRDLHDGAQQRFVQTIMTLQVAQRRAGDDPELAGLVGESLDSARAGLEELRELARGIHPAILTNHGLAAAVEALADRAPLPVEVEIADTRFAPSVESAAYFVAAEALTNAAKHSGATSVRVTGGETRRRLRLEVRDDGAGGAQEVPGSGLAGLADRVAALDGELTVDSPPGGGTRLVAEIPLGAAP